MIRLNKMIVARDGLDMGIKIRHKICHWLAPSSFADSSSSDGIPRKKFMRTMQLKIGTAPGMISAHTVSISFVLETM